MKNKQRLFSLILLALLMSSGLLFSLKIAPVHASSYSTYLELYPSNFVSDVSQWSVAGSSPYIDYFDSNDATGISEGTVNEVMSYFVFEDMPYNTLSVQNVTLNVRGRMSTTGAPNGIQSYMENAVGSWADSGGWYFTSSYQNVTSSVDAIVGTSISDVNDAKLRFKKLGSSYTAYVDGASLIVGCILGDVPDVGADLEPDSSGVGWVFTDWRYYTFTLDISSDLYSGDLDFVYLGFTEIETFNGTISFAAWTDGVAWEAESNFGLFLTGRELDAIRVKEGAWSNDSDGTIVTFPLWFTDACLDVYSEDDPVDAWMWFNDTTGYESGWVDPYPDLFRIYNTGGFSLNAVYSGDPGESGVLPGGRDFSMFAYNGSSAYKDLIWRDLQHIKMMPTVNFRAGLETFQLYYGFDFMLMDGSWCTGLNLRLEPSFVSYTGVFASNVWINMTASWFYNNGLVKEDVLYMFYHGDVYTDTDPGRWSFWVDFWFDNTNASSVMGGRVNAYEFPVQDSSAAWFRWLSSNWGVKDDVLKQSECLVPLEDTDGNLIRSEQIQFVKVHSALNVYDLDSGQYVAVTDFTTFDSTLGGSPLKGIQNPPWDETVMPAMRNTGVLGAIWSMFQGIGKWLGDNILFGGLNLWSNFVAFLDTIAGWLGAPGFFTNLFNWIGEGFTYLESSAIYAWELLSNLFTMIGSLLSAFVFTIGELIASFVNTLSYFVDFMGGGIGAAGNLWDSLGIMTWLTVAIIFYPLYLVILWEEKGMDAVIQQLTWIFGILVFLYHFFEGLVMGVISLVTSLIESIPVVE